MTLLALPKDALLDIWSFVTSVRDIFRFRATCKYINSLAFQTPRSIYLNRDDHTLEIMNDIFGCDLSQVTKLELDHRYSHYGESHWTMKRLSILPTLHNLTSLQLLVDLDSESVFDLAEIIKKMTWLRELTAQFPEGEHIGELLLDHRFLTALTIKCNEESSGESVPGVDQLTQVKSLKFRKGDGGDLDQILTLANLTELEVCLEMGEENPAALIAKNLTNLESFVLYGSAAGDFEWKEFKKLPKLRNLEVDVSDSWAEEENLDEPVNRLNELAQLTRLKIVTAGMEYVASTEKLSNLTNLRELVVELELDTPIDFSKFPYLTKLAFKALYDPETSEEQIQLPQGLKNLTMDQMSINYSLPFMKKVFALTSLERLSISFERRTKVWPDAAFDISRLTNLTCLDLHEGPIPKGLGQSLKKLPNLRVMCVKDFGELNLPDLVDLKLIELRAYKPKNIEDFRQKLPFLVNIGQSEEPY